MQKFWNKANRAYYKNRNPEKHRELLNERWDKLLQERENIPNHPKPTTQNYLKNITRIEQDNLIDEYNKSLQDYPVSRNRFKATPAFLRQLEIDKENRRLAREGQLGDEEVGDEEEHLYNGKFDGGRRRFNIHKSLRRRKSHNKKSRKCSKSKSSKSKSRRR
jgi:hypothetical protein